MDSVLHDGVTVRAPSTMNAVAKAAGVSLGTVSNYLNEPTRVAPVTQRKVQAAIERLGYIRNGAARDLKRRRSDGIGLIVPDILNRLFVDIARGAQIWAGTEGLSLLMANAFFSFESFSPHVTSDRQDEFLDFFAQQRTRGILFAAMRDPTASIARIRGHVRPIVVINYDQQGDWCSVLMDNRQAGRIAAEHLAEGGVQRIVFLSPPDAAQPIADRRLGVHEAAMRLGLAVSDVSTAGLWFEDGYRAAADVLERARPSEPFGVVGVTDELALGVLRVLREQPAIRVPSDVSVVGLDGTHGGADSHWLSLTSIVAPGNAMGEQAMRLVLAEGEPGHRHERLVLPVELHQGASTASTPVVKPFTWMRDAGGFYNLV